METALVYIKIYGVLSQSLTREDFLKEFDIGPHETEKLISREPRSKIFPPIAKRFGKELGNQETTIKTKRQVQ